MPDAIRPRRLYRADIESANPRGKRSRSERGSSWCSLSPPRARRYPFAASLEMIDIESETQSNEQRCDLSLFGCGVHTQKPLAPGTRVRIRIVHNGASFVALGKGSLRRKGRANGSVVHEDRTESAFGFGKVDRGAAGNERGEARERVVGRLSSEPVVMSHLGKSGKTEK